VRDDLHHSMPMTHPWWRAVRAASGKGVKWDIEEEVRRAAWSSGAADWWHTGFGRQFRLVLSECHLDIFGKDKLIHSLEGLEMTCPVSARRALDCAFAEALADRVDADLHDRVIGAAVALSAEDNLQNAVAYVRAKYGEYQAGELSIVLRDALKRCTVASEPEARPRVRKEKLTTEQALSIRLSYTPAA
jgi:hypothetical protein